MPEPDDLMLNLLKAIRTDMAATRADISEIKERLGLLESGYSSLSRRVDRIAGELETINRRFDVVEGDTINLGTKTRRSDFSARVTSTISRMG